MAEDIETGPAETHPGKSQDSKSAPTHYSPDAPDADVESRGGVGAAGRGATGPDAHPYNLKGAKFSGRPTNGSISPGIGYLYVLVAMFLIIGAGTLLSGGFVPVDPNGPGGPPTLPPYFNSADYGVQKKIFPSNADRPADKNLQLKTFKVNTCGQKTAIDFLIDTSGSMKLDGKIGKEKDALKALTKQLTNKSVIGMHTFSKNAREEVPISFYGDVKDQVAQKIEGLEPDRETRTRDGFSLVKQKLTEVISANKYPGYSYNLVLLTDGVPEIPPEQPRTCYFEAFDPTYNGNRCFAKEQDPRIPTNLPADIKGMGVTIYSVGIFSQTSTDKQFYPYLSSLLKEIATSPDHYYESIEGGNLDKILNEVLNNICEEQGEIAVPETIR
jgi:hypothetical protein